MTKVINKMTGDNLLDDVIYKLSINNVSEVINEITKEQLIELLNINLTFPLPKDDNLFNEEFIIKEFYLKYDKPEFQKSMLLSNPLWVSFFKLFKLCDEKAINLVKRYYEILLEGVNRENRVEFIQELAIAIGYNDTISFQET